MPTIEHNRPHESPQARRRAAFVLGRARSGDAGFTLLELVLVLAIVSVLSGVAVLGYGRTLAGYRVSAAAERVAQDITLTQMRARSASTARAIVFSTVQSAYGILDEPGVTNPSAAYVVKLGNDPYLATLTTANFGGTGKLVFDGYGQPSSGGTVVVTVGTLSKTVTVDASTGKVSVAN